jgi:hypothetical protein
MDQVIGHMTRSQTGHGVFFGSSAALITTRRRPKPIITLLDPAFQTAKRFGRRF